MTLPPIDDIFAELEETEPEEFTEPSLEAANAYAGEEDLDLRPEDEAAIDRILGRDR